MPLDALLENGVEYMIELAKRQRDIFKSKAGVDSSKSQDLVRFQKVSSFGTVEMYFKAPVNVPEGLKDAINK